MAEAVMETHRTVHTGHQNCQSRKPFEEKLQMPGIGATGRRIEVKKHALPVWTYFGNETRLEYPVLEQFCNHDLFEMEIKITSFTWPKAQRY